MGGDHPDQCQCPGHVDTPGPPRGRCHRRLTDTMSGGFTDGGGVRFLDAHQDLRDSYRAVRLAREMAAMPGRRIDRKVMRARRDTGWCGDMGSASRIEQVDGRCGAVRSGDDCRTGDTGCPQECAGVCAEASVRWGISALASVVDTRRPGTRRHGYAPHHSGRLPTARHAARDSVCSQNLNGLFRPVRRALASVPAELDDDNRDGILRTIPAIHVVARDVDYSTRRRRRTITGIRCHCWRADAILVRHEQYAAYRITGIPKIPSREDSFWCSRHHP
jgi:hypothetical protein